MPADNANTPNSEPRRTYHAEAAALHGRLERPLDQLVPPQSYLKLKEHGGYLSQDSDRFRVEGLISYSAAFSQVAGTEEKNKPGHGFVTLATAVVENLNILEVVTADRVVAQVSTEHPKHGHVPRITFLGSRFENLRIAGQLIDVPIDPYPLWDEEVALKNEDTEDVHRKRDLNRLKRIAAFDVPDLKLLHPPEDLPDSYPAGKLHPDADPKRHDHIHASLVGDSRQERKGWLSLFEKQPARHVFDVPHFGRVYLGLICIEHLEYVNNVPRQTRVKLSMIKVKLGCTATGTATGPTTRINGITS